MKSNNASGLYGKRTERCLIALGYACYRKWVCGWKPQRLAKECHAEMRLKCASRCATCMQMLLPVWNTVPLVLSFPHITDYIRFPNASCTTTLVPHLFRNGKKRKRTWCPLDHVCILLTYGPINITICYYSPCHSTSCYVCLV